MEIIKRKKRKENKKGKANEKQKEDKKQSKSLSSIILFSTAPTTDDPNPPTATAQLTPYVSKKRSTIWLAATHAMTTYEINRLTEIEIAHADRRR